MGYAATCGKSISKKKVSTTSRVVSLSDEFFFSYERGNGAHVGPLELLCGNASPYSHPHGHSGEDAENRRDNRRDHGIVSDLPAAEVHGGILRGYRDGRENISRETEGAVDREPVGPTHREILWLCSLLMSMLQHCPSIPHRCKCSRNLWDHRSTSEGRRPNNQSEWIVSWILLRSIPFPFFSFESLTAHCGIDWAWASAASHVATARTPHRPRMVAVCSSFEAKVEFSARNQM